MNRNALDTGPRLDAAYVAAVGDPIGISQWATLESRIAQAEELAALVNEIAAKPWTARREVELVTARSVAQDFGWQSELKVVLTAAEDRLPAALSWARSFPECPDNLDVNTWNWATARVPISIGGGYSVDAERPVLTAGYR